MEKQFPRTMVGGKSLSRMIIGTNWMAGWSHTGAAADAMIKERHSTPDTLIPMFEKFLEYGVDTVMAPFGAAPVVLRAVKETEYIEQYNHVIVNNSVVEAAEEINDIVCREVEKRHMHEEFIENFINQYNTYK